MPTSTGPGIATLRCSGNRQPGPPLMAQNQAVSHTALEKGWRSSWVIYVQKGYVSHKGVWTQKFKKSCWAPRATPQNAGRLSAQP